MERLDNLIFNSLNQTKDIDIMWMLSPPCQPYTRQGNMKDTSDTRARPFLHLLSLLHSTAYSPRYILLENVANFELSLTLKLFKDALNNGGYNYQEFLISPLMIAIPNQRLRYFLIVYYIYIYIYYIG